MTSLQADVFPSPLLVSQLMSSKDEVSEIIAIEWEYSIDIRVFLGNLRQPQETFGKWSETLVRPTNDVKSGKEVFMLFLPFPSAALPELCLLGSKNNNRLE